MATMLASNLDVIDGDMNSPEWIVRNVVIDMAGYWLNDIADSAVIDDDAMTYTIHLNDAGKYTDRTITLTFQQIWNVVNKMARMSVTDLDVSKNVRDGIRAAAFDKDGDEIDAEVGYAIIQFAMFGEIPFM